LSHMRQSFVPKRAAPQRAVSGLPAGGCTMMEAMNDDAELLERYAATGAESAFAELVRRHFDLAWSVARRITGDAELARDVAQTVFADLARKARWLPRGTIVPGWLHRAACLAAWKVNRANRRRAERERQAMELETLRAEPDPVPPEAARLLPQLDEALAALGATDRDAVVLRFLSHKSLAEVGATLGVKEDAARKRVARAMDKLRDWFARRGPATTTTAVVAALGLAGSQLAPVGVAATVTTAAIAGAGTLGILETLVLMKTKIALSTLAVAAVATPLTYQQLALNRAHAENRALAVQVAAANPAPSAEALAKREAEAAELERLRAEHLELLRLRGEIAKLRAAATRAAELEREVTALRSRSTPAVSGHPDTETPVDPQAMEEQKRIGIAKLNVFKQWALAVHLYAGDHEDQVPPTLAAARMYLGTSANDAAAADSGLTENDVELVYQGKLSAARNLPQTILARERQPWVDVRGRPARTYAFLDGHAEIHAAPDGDFETWEARKQQQAGE
jgi:RNA polymerase sigma factor (sigma-70 family)